MKVAEVAVSGNEAERERLGNNNETEENNS